MRAKAEKRDPRRIRPGKKMLHFEAPKIRGKPHENLRLRNYLMEFHPEFDPCVLEVGLEAQERETNKRKESGNESQ